MVASGHIVQLYDDATFLVLVKPVDLDQLEGLVARLPAEGKRPALH